MKTIKQKMVTSSVIHSKIEFQKKYFSRFQYQSRGNVLDILWLSEDRQFISELLEQKLEEEFQKKQHGDS